MVVFHPAFGVIFACLPMIAVLVFFSSMFDRGEDYQRYKDQIAISDSQIVFGETKSNATVGVIGTFKNNSPIPWKEIRFHIDFFDAAGKRVDVRQDEQYSYYLPPHDSLSFKVSFRREFPVASYVRQEIRVVSATDGRARW